MKHPTLWTFRCEANGRYMIWKQMNSAGVLDINRQRQSRAHLEQMTRKLAMIRTIPVLHRQRSHKTTCTRDDGYYCIELWRFFLFIMKPLYRTYSTWWEHFAHNLSNVRSEATIWRVINGANQGGHYRRRYRRYFTCGMSEPLYWRVITMIRITSLHVIIISVLVCSTLCCVCDPLFCEDH